MAPNFKVGLFTFLWKGRHISQHTTSHMRDIQCKLWYMAFWYHIIIFIFTLRLISSENWQGSVYLAHSQWHEDGILGWQESQNANIHFRFLCLYIFYSRINVQSVKMKIQIIHWKNCKFRMLPLSLLIEESLWMSWLSLFGTQTVGDREMESLAWEKMKMSEWKLIVMWYLIFQIFCQTGD